MTEKPIIPVFFIKISQLAYCIFSFAVLRIFASLEIEGQENIKEVEDGPLIFASNHSSYIDSGISAAAMPKNGVFLKKIAPLKFLVMDKYFSWKIFPVRIFLEAVGAIRISKAKVKHTDNSHLYDILVEPINLLKQGGKVWIYPEGGFHKDGTPKKPRVGTAFMHQQTKAPILPIRIIGNDKVMSKIVPFLPRLKTLMGLNKIKVIIGKPIYSFENLSLENMTEEIMKSIYKLEKSPLTKYANERNVATSCLSERTQ